MVTIKVIQSNDRPLTRWFNKLTSDFTPAYSKLTRVMHIRVQYIESKHCLHLKKQYTFGHYFCDTCWAQTDNAGEWFGGIYRPFEPYTSNPYEVEDV